MDVCHPPTSAVADLVLEALDGHRGPGPVVVGIDGRSGAGKTRFAGALVHRLRADPALSADAAVATFALEDAYRGWTGLAVGLGAVASGVLEPLSHGEPGRVRRYDWHAERTGEPVRVPPPGDPMPQVLVLEGCGAGAAICAPFVHVLVWLEAPEEVRRERALARDDDDWAELWEVWAAQETALLESRDARAAADVVIET